MTLNAPIALRLTEEWREKIEKLAKEEQRPFSHMTRILLEQGFAARTAKKAKKQ